MAVLALVNQKGGVGKTTVALGLAASAQRRGLRCLVVDLDPQANATSGLGVWDATDTIDRVLEDDRPGRALTAVVASTWPADAGPAPELVPGSPALAAVEPRLAADPVGAQDRLAVALEGSDHDLVVIDCPPSLGLLTVNALFAADEAAVVTEPGAWAVDGVAQIVTTIERIRRRRGEGLGFAGIIVNRLARTRDARYWYDHLVTAYPDDTFEPIHQRAAVAEAAAQALPLHALGARPGTREALDEFDVVFDGLVATGRPAATQGEAATVTDAGPSVVGGPRSDSEVWPRA